MNAAYGTARLLLASSPGPPAGLRPPPLGGSHRCYSLLQFAGLREVSSDVRGSVCPPQPPCRNLPPGLPQPRSPAGLGPLHTGTVRGRVGQRRGSRASPSTHVPLAR